MSKAPGQQRLVTAVKTISGTFECFLEIRSRAFLDAANIRQVKRAVAPLLVGGCNARALHLVGRR